MFFVRNLLEIHDTKDSIVNNEHYPIEPGEHEISSQHAIIQQADWQSLPALANQEIRLCLPDHPFRGHVGSGSGGLGMRLAWSVSSQFPVRHRFCEGTNKHTN